MHKLKVTFERHSKIECLYIMNIELIKINWEDVFSKTHHYVCFKTNERQHSYNDPTSFPNMSEYLFKRIDEIMSRKLFFNDVKWPMYSPYSSQNDINKVLYELHNCCAFVKDESTENDVLQAIKNYLLTDPELHKRIIIDIILRTYEYELKKIRNLLKSKNQKLSLRTVRDLETIDILKYFTLEEFGTDILQVILFDGFNITSIRRINSFNELIDENNLLKVGYPLRDIKITFGYPEVNIHFRKKRLWTGTPVETFSLNKASAIVCKHFDRQTNEVVLDLTEQDLIKFLKENNHLFHSINTANEPPKIKLEFPSFKANDKPFFIPTSPLRNLRVIDMTKMCSLLGIPAKPRKEELIEHLAKKIALRYKDSEEEKMNKLFSEEKFITMGVGYSKSDSHLPKTFTPTKEGNDQEQNLDSIFKIIYLYRHLRGNSIIDPNYLNDSLEEEDIVLSILNNTFEYPPRLMKVR